MTQDNNTNLHYKDLENRIRKFLKKERKHAEEYLMLKYAVNLFYDNLLIDSKQGEYLSDLLINVLPQCLPCGVK